MPLRGRHSDAVECQPHQGHYISGVLGLDYDLLDISADPTARDLVLSLGYLSAPVVVSADGHWSGFRPDRIKALANQAA